MDKICASLFNDGDNEGNVIIISQDNVAIHCHEFVVVHTSRFFKHTILPAKLIRPEQFILRLDMYPAIVIIEVINLMYHHKHPINQTLTAQNLIQLHVLVQFLQFTHLSTDADALDKKIIEQFNHKLNKDNWLSLMEKVFPDNKIFVTAILSFYRERMIVADDFVTTDPLRAIKSESALARFMVQNYRAWLRADNFLAIDINTAMEKACENTQLDVSMWFRDRDRKVPFVDFA